MNRRLYFTGSILTFTVCSVILLSYNQLAAFFAIIPAVVVGLASISLYQTDAETTQLKNIVSDLKSHVKLPTPFNWPLTEKGFQKRQALYSIIKPCRSQKMGWKEIILMLEIEYPDFPRDENILRDTLNAGDAGCLEVWPPDFDEGHRREREMKKSKNRNSGFQ